MKSVLLTVDDTIEGEKLWVRYKQIGHELWIHFNGETWVEDLRPVVRTTKASKGVGRNEVLAPMPGKILRVNASIGQKVQVGDVLVIMEAMKMEYSLEAERSGVVEAVNCRQGDQVELGTQLVKLRASVDSANIRDSKDYTEK